MPNPDLGERDLREEIYACRKCARLVAWREEVARVKRRAYRDQDYWGRPISGFGDRLGRVLVVGLAPGAHGANRTGRVFTGDSSGDFLFRSLHAAGFANQPTSHTAADGLALTDMFIAAVCRCAPPDNKPTPDEIMACLPFLEREMALMPNLQGIVVLGRIAFDYTLRLLRTTTLDKNIGNAAGAQKLEFAHGGFYDLGEGLPWLAACYHPSRQNTQTGRLTEAMYTEFWAAVKLRLSC